MNHSQVSTSTLAFAAIQVVLKAGSLLQKGFSTSFRISSKEGKRNLVTEYDTAAQDLIIEEIKTFFPRHHFLAEEGKFDRYLPQEEIIWIIDPLDGTVNFAHGIPHFSISIAAAQNRDILTGVVYHPMTGELFVAEKNNGAYLNGNRLHVSKTKTFDEALMATGFPYNVEENPLKCLDRFQKMSKMGIPIRRLGSAALDLAYVAAGKFDVYWEVGLHPWDMAAGKLMVEEAGGKVSHYNGSEHKLYGYDNILASNTLLHSQMVKILSEDIK
ncbi:MAG: inositol monophosphatase [Chlamydiae bacterium]|nr:inositol monophosphatase [Chlamydiota bacterium]